MNKYPELIQIGREIRKLRKLKNLSQEKLAELSSLHRNYIGAIERAEKNFGLSTLIKLAVALDARPSIILLEAEQAGEYSSLFDTCQENL